MDIQHGTNLGGRRVMQFGQAFGIQDCLECVHGHVSKDQAIREGLCQLQA